MINLSELANLRPAFSWLSVLIDFPAEAITQEELLAASAEFPNLPEKAEFLALLQDLAETDLTALQENYTALFELNKRLTLYCTYYKFEDSRERGTILAKLKLLYEMFGVSLDMAELADYLPTMLEFLALGDWSGEAEDGRLQDLQLLFSVLEDGTYEMLAQAAEFKNEAYIKLLRLIRQVARRCVVQVQEERVTTK